MKIVSMLLFVLQRQKVCFIKDVASLSVIHGNIGSFSITIVKQPEKYSAPAF